MTAKKKTEPKTQAPVSAETPVPGSSSSRSTEKGGLAELQERADQITARGCTGPEKESIND